MRLLLFLALFAASVHAAVEGLNPDGSLNRAKISKYYFEGEFDKVQAALETFRKLHPDPSREDKIYTYKYLSVIYASKPETQAKAESYMYQLLKLMPSIELMDLYISDNIEAIFNTVRVRFEKQQHLAMDTAAAPPGDAGGSRDGKGGKEGKGGSAGAGQSGRRGGNTTWMWWTAAGVGAAVAVAGYVHMSEVENNGSPKTRFLDF